MTSHAHAAGNIRVTGARLHNLRDVDVEVPRDRLVAFTGISGSGKSSLAFGTIHGEAQRRYFDSVAPFARRLIHTALDPQVRDITGLPPTVALQQQHAGGTSRSTVGTITTTGNTLRMLFSRCGDYPDGVAPMDSDHFSAHTAAGACPRCSGLGHVHRPTERSMVPDPTLSIEQGAIAAWPGAWQGKNYRDIVATLGYDITAPWRELPQGHRDFILFSDTQPVVTVVPERAVGRVHRPYEGRFVSAERYLMRTLSETQSATQRERALRYVVTSACTQCHGRRLRAEALAVRWQGLAIDEAAHLTIEDLTRLVRRRLEELEDPQASTAVGVSQAATAAEQLLLEELASRLSVVIDLGIGHLDLARPSTSVSAGELQRLRLASALRSGLFGVVYVLDEPSAGLHPRDVQSLLRVLRDLVRAGNTVLVVEHDMAVVGECDWVVDIGPGAGQHGGRVLYSGLVNGLDSVGESVTARYRDRQVHPSDLRQDPEQVRTPTGELRLTGISRHTLAGVDVTVPVAVLTVVEGVSGSGKSTLLDVVAQAVSAGDAATPDVAGLSGHGERVPKRLVRITQRPIGRTPRSNLATYTGLFDHVRALFARTPVARERGYRAGRFSFNVASGRCPTCQGEGFVAVELLFLPGTYSPCPDCLGARYNEETLQVTWRGHTIADVLAWSVAQARHRFSEEPLVGRALAALDSLGLGYLTLGQPATELSGGEAQRIKLATELQAERRDPTLYLLDEPASGLHPEDVHRLLRHLHALVDAGHTVLMAEHHPAALASADWVMELGPGAGRAGGRVVRSGARA
ncbi:MAG TPA: excinuclease ABC subunit UvrA [Ornithinimicrobium sp.]|uniref:excinuclease ABC subunit UvrA n=1 Tax=Ornithinimicrobium sp. TaxID=1977084 RepID=UPI002B4604B6|nr:excinuclease ABC subunit UvrA [Ornithinimicrobium sp.]HKJ10821.1 excinuclease ABC subunit UvrA [Ornithinimicrobium sp.]